MKSVVLSYCDFLDVATIGTLDDEDTAGVGARLNGLVGLDGERDDGLSLEVEDAYIGSMIQR